MPSPHPSARSSLNSPSQRTFPKILRPFPCRLPLCHCPSQNSLVTRFRMVPKPSMRCLRNSPSQTTPTFRKSRPRPCGTPLAISPTQAERSFPNRQCCSFVLLGVVFGWSGLEGRSGVLLRTGEISLTSRRKACFLAIASRTSNSLLLACASLSPSFRSSISLASFSFYKNSRTPFSLAFSSRLLLAAIAATPFSISASRAATRCWASLRASESLGSWRAARAVRAVRAGWLQCGQSVMVVLWEGESVERSRAERAEA